MKEIDQPPNLFIIYELGLPRLPKKNLVSGDPTLMELGTPQMPPKSGIWGVPGSIGVGPPDPKFFLGSLGSPNTYII